ncbi:MAG: two-component system response regulator [Desulfuromonas sp.]|nr:MAG: two-component system response regulator [Desulfuromonas sp.]
MAVTTGRRKRFGEILIEAGVLTETLLKGALRRQKESGRRLGQELEEMGVVTEKDIAAALGRQFGFKTVRGFSKHKFPPEILDLIDVDTVTRAMIFPLKKENNSVYMAMVNPLDMETIDHFTFRTGLRIIPCVTTPTEIQAAINRHYHGEEEIVPDEISVSDWWEILVVDDQELSRAAVAAALKKEAYSVKEAENGAVGLKLAMQSPPHLIVCDTVMPRMDGYEMFRALQGNTKTRKIPVIALSSKSSPEEEARLLDMGYYDFIAKPTNPLRLIARVKRALRQVYGDAPPLQR